MRIYILKLINHLIYIIFFITSKSKKQNFNDKLAKIFVNINNEVVLNKAKKITNGKILILIPHCLQLYTCKYRVTNDIKNCIECNKCVISYFKSINVENIIVKVASGGTLARKFIKEIKPDLVIAIACKRDLVSGIKDAQPFPVFGVFNKINSEPCISTSVSTENIEEVLVKLK